jgi:hypothetical protein
MLEKIAFSLKKRAHELFFYVHYEKKIEKEWQTQLLIELEQFIHTQITKIKKNTSS